MSVGIQKITIYRISVILLVSFFLIDCSNSIDSSAPISSIKKEDAFLGSSNRIMITPSAIRYKNKNKNTHINIISTLTSISRSHIHLPVLTRRNKLSVYAQARSNHVFHNRNYKYIQKGSYREGNTYTVKRGDTLFYIAWITGNDLKNLIQLNNIQYPCNLDVGKILQVRKFDNMAPKDYKAKPTLKVNTLLTPKTTFFYSKHTTTQQTNNNNNKMPSTNRKSADTTLSPIASSIVTPSKLVVGDTVSKKKLIPLWHWPTRYSVIERHVHSTEEIHGINITGKKGQAIVAAADGCVVYVGNALRGYGNLIIIKHNNDYLSIYAHNDAILVREKQKVIAGQKIATMGSTGTNSTHLHFEIRYKGKSVNPLQYLPKQ